MKQIKDYILEKFQITKDSKSPYSCYPKDKDELRKILEERLAKDKDADLNDIDVSQITDMAYVSHNGYYGLFFGLDPHNIKIDFWDTSIVKDISFMFYGCENFNCNLGNWDVSNVKDMHYMFYKCNKFKGEGLENWNPVNCKDMDWMFDGCDSLKNIPSWHKE